ncbi:MAG: hypothetical protein KAI70_02040 [Candidatus Omnitrophica bacterium]|nr:hypothetical protein [Candidatus Omnitrophota bacterium]
MKTTKDIVLKVVFVMAVLVVTAILISNEPILESIGQAPKAALSIDQQKFVDKLGYPDVFVVTMEGDRRKEIWTYFDHEKHFYFNNGVFSDHRTQEKLPDGFVWPKLRPTEFKNGMTEKELEQIFNKPTAAGRVNLKIMEGIKFYDYYNQVKVAIFDGKIIYVQTLPVPTR